MSPGVIATPQGLQEAEQQPFMQVLVEKTAGPRDEYTYKGLPSFDFSYVLPLTKNFGISVNGVTSNQYSGMKHELTST